MAKKSEQMQRDAWLAKQSKAQQKRDTRSAKKAEINEAKAESNRVAAEARALREQQRAEAKRLREEEWAAKNPQKAAAQAAKQEAANKAAAQATLRRKAEEEYRRLETEKLIEKSKGWRYAYDKAQLWLPESASRPGKIDWSRGTKGTGFGTSGGWQAFDKQTGQTKQGFNPAGYSAGLTKRKALDYKNNEWWAFKSKYPGSM
jgi:hypothetical protein